MIDGQSVDIQTMSLKRNSRSHNIDTCDIDNDAAMSASRFKGRHYVSSSTRLMGSKIRDDDDSDESGRHTVKNKYADYRHRSDALIDQRSMQASSAFIGRLDGYLKQIKINEAAKDKSTIKSKIKSKDKSTIKSAIDIDSQSRRQSMISRAADINLADIVKDQCMQIDRLNRMIDKLTDRYDRLLNKVDRLDVCHRCMADNRRPSIDLSNRLMIGKSSSGMFSVKQSTAGLSNYRKLSVADGNRSITKSTVDRSKAPFIDALTAVVGKDAFIKSIRKTKMIDQSNRCLMKDNSKIVKASMIDDRSVIESTAIRQSTAVNKSSIVDHRFMKHRTNR